MSLIVHSYSPSRRKTKPYDNRKYRCLQAGKVTSRERFSGRGKSGDPTGIRTPVTTVKGSCPRPLDDRVAD